jgi:hypothetical protein
MCCVHGRLAIGITLGSPVSKSSFFEVEVPGLRSGWRTAGTSNRQEFRMGVEVELMEQGHQKEEGFGCDLIERTRMSVTSSKEFPEDTCPLVRCHRKLWWVLDPAPDSLNSNVKPDLGYALTFLMGGWRNSSRVVLELVWD